MKFGVFLFLSVVLSARGELIWSARGMSIDAKPTQSFVVAVFPYTNESTTERAPELGELAGGVTLVDAPAVSPGAQGELKVSIPVGTVAGKKTVTIPLKSGEPLTVVLHIPEHVEITPRRLGWAKGTANPAKEVRVTLVTLEGIVLTRAKAVRGDFTCEVKRINERDYLISVTPGPTDRPMTGIIQVMGKESTGERPVFNLYADVR